jgi:hypothetical protein
VDRANLLVALESLPGLSGTYLNRLRFSSFLESFCLSVQGMTGCAEMDSSKDNSFAFFIALILVVAGVGSAAWKHLGSASDSWAQAPAILVVSPSPLLGELSSWILAWVCILLGVGIISLFLWLYSKAMKWGQGILNDLRASISFNAQELKILRAERADLSSVKELREEIAKLSQRLKKTEATVTQLSSLLPEERSASDAHVQRALDSAVGQLLGKSPSSGGTS